jgi:Ca2+-binding RTX toxin-like protein
MFGLRGFPAGSLSRGVSVRPFRLRLLAVLTTIVLAGAAPAGAEVHVQPSFTVVDIKGSDGDDRISIRCERDRLVVNGRKAVGGRLHCSALRRIRVFGLKGDDRITYSAEPSGGLFAGLFESRVTPEISVGRGNDRVVARGTDAAVTAGPGKDVINATVGLNFLDGGSGRDKVFGGRGIDFVFAGPGSDRVEGRGFLDFLLGAAGNDDLLGGEGPDALVAARGRDYLLGLADADLVLGGSGPDRAFGGPGRDQVFGGSGRDQVGGGPGKDTVSQEGRRGRAGGLFGAIIDVFSRAVSPEHAGALRRAAFEARARLP